MLIDIDMKGNQMNNKGVGSVFCLIAALLMSARYISAAIFVSSSPSWSADHFQAALQYNGPVLLILAIAAAVIGICFIIAGLVQDKKGR